LGDDFIAALIERAAAGLDIRIAYDHTKPNTNDAEPFAILGGDPAPKGTHLFLSQRFTGTGVRIKPILTIPDAVANAEVTTEPIAGSHLMHSKYVVRDGATASATVWTGSTNFTDDAWTHQENNIIQIGSAALCELFERDFEELWASGNIATTGVHDSGTIDVSGASVDVAFAPGEGPTIDADLAALVSTARTRIKVASMVMSSHKILGALNDAIEAGIEVAGVYDATQMAGILKSWHKSGNPAAPAFESVAKKLVGKASKPYTKTGLHNFMHNKVLVVDETAATGSFNLSTNATHNAENSLIVHNARLADEYASYIDLLIAAYT
jgi:phosphatidylserine/phosphatidylglycerophosphate/cardiolipin synthase-like enzyme